MLKFILKTINTAFKELNASVLKESVIEKLQYLHGIDLQQQVNHRKNLLKQTFEENDPYYKIFSSWAKQFQFLEEHLTPNEILRVAWSLWISSKKVLKIVNNPPLKEDPWYVEFLAWLKNYENTINESTNNVSSEYISWLQKNIAALEKKLKKCAHKENSKLYAQLSHLHELHGKSILSARWKHQVTYEIYADSIFKSITAYCNSWFEIPCKIESLYCKYIQALYYAGDINKAIENAISLKNHITQWVYESSYDDTQIDEYNTINTLTYISLLLEKGNLLPSNLSMDKQTIYSIAYESMSTLLENRIEHWKIERNIITSDEYSCNLRFLFGRYYYIWWDKSLAKETFKLIDPESTRYAFAIKLLERWEFTFVFEDDTKTKKIDSPLKIVT